MQWMQKRCWRCWKRKSWKNGESCLVGYGNDAGVRSVVIQIGTGVIGLKGVILGLVRQGSSILAVLFVYRNVVVTGYSELASVGTPVTVSSTEPPPVRVDGAAEITTAGVAFAMVKSAVAVTSL